MNFDGAFAKMQSARDAFVAEADQPEDIGLSWREVKRCRDWRYRQNCGQFFGRIGVGHGALSIDGAPNHRCGDLAVPNNITLLYLPPYSPELNPKENLWMKSANFKNYALKSMDAVRAKLKQAILYIEHNPKLVRSISSFPYIVNSL